MCIRDRHKCKLRPAKCAGMDSKSMCGERKSVDNNTLGEWKVTCLSELTSQYDPKGMFNLDETDIFKIYFLTAQWYSKGTTVMVGSALNVLRIVRNQRQKFSLTVGKLVKVTVF